MDIYTYKPKLYFVSVTLTSIFSFVMLVVSIFSIVMNYHRGIMIAVSIISFYTVWNSFIAKVNTKEVRLNESEIVFSSFGRDDIYKIDQINQFRIREFPSSGKMYIRVNDGGFLKGRYWLSTLNFDKGEELFRKLIDFEYRFHPDSLKAKARRVNTEYLENKKKDEEAKAINASNNL